MKLRLWLKLHNSFFFEYRLKGVLEHDMIANKMHWIVVTSPDFFPGEAMFIHRLLAYGVDIVHLRKPLATVEDCERFLAELSSEERSHIVIHDFFELVEPYGLRGIHLNARRNFPPVGYKGHVSRSCHSLEEVKRYKNQCDYVFLSPIFDSVSKHGYTSAFSDNILRQASEENIIDNKVIALGGVTSDKIDYLHSLHFGGVAMLGSIYNMVQLEAEEQIKCLNAVKAIFETL